MKHVMTAMQFMHIMQLLPNPKKHLQENNGFLFYNVAYIPHEENLSRISVDEKPYYRGKEIRFMLVPSYDGYNWQPTEDITIKAA